MEGVLMSGFGARVFHVRVEWESFCDFVRRNVRTKYGLTILVEFFLLVAAILTLRLSAALLGPTGFGEYAVARRAQSIGAFTLLCGLGIGIPRQVAISAGAWPTRTARGVYLAAGLTMELPILLVFGVLMILGSDVVARILFGDVRFAHLVIPTVMLTVGSCLHTIIYGYFRGHLAMGKANVLQIINNAIVLPIALMISQHSAANALKFSGLGVILVCFLYLFLLVRNHHFSSLTSADLQLCSRELLAYGLPRVAGEFALFGLFTVPTIMVAHRSGIEAAGFFSLALSLVQVIGGLYSGLGILLLPVVSDLVGKKDWGRIERVVGVALGLTVLVALAMVAVLESSIDFAIPTFLGASFVSAIRDARLILLGGVPYAVYLILRNPLDAISVWPYNSLNLSVSLGFCVLLLMFAGDYASPAGSVAVTFGLLGMLSFLAWRSGYSRARTRDEAAVVLSGSIAGEGVGF